MDENETRKLFAPIPADLHRRIKVQAIDENRSLQDVVRAAVEEYLERHATAALPAER